MQNSKCKTLQKNSYLFTKSKNPTNFIFLANAPQFTQIPSTESIRQFFKPFSKNIEIHFSKNNSINVSLDSIDSAINAMRNLNNNTSNKLNGHIVHLRFSSPLFPMKPIVNEIQCVCESSQEPFPEGLIYIENAISVEQEQILLDFIDSQEWTKDLGRRSQYYGFKFDRKTHQIDLFNDQTVKYIPPILFPKFSPEKYKSLTSEIESTKSPMLTNKLITKLKKSDQIIIDEYIPGKGLRCLTHDPNSLKDFIFSLSLGSGTTMTFRNTQKELRKDIYLKRRSLLVMSHEVRYEWQHGISPRKTDRNCNESPSINGLIPRQRRISITYRKSRKDVRKSGEKGANKTPQIEADFVHDFYNATATHFSHTRGIKWPQVLKFIESIPKGSLVTDIACGNGKYFESIKKESFVCGFDNCKGLLEIAKAKKGANDVVITDALNLPLRSNVSDYVICVALLHHISTIERRKKCAEELIRVLKPGGKLFCCAWAKEQEENSRFRFDETDCLVDWKLQRKHVNDEMVRKMDHFESNAKTITVSRFCHVFQRGELEQLFSNNFCTIEKSFYNSGNWCVVVKYNLETNNDN